MRTFANEGRDHFRVRPFCLGVELFGELVPAVFVRGRDLCDVVFADGALERNQELRVKVSERLNVFGSGREKPDTHAFYDVWDGGELLLLHLRLLLYLMLERRGEYGVVESRLDCWTRVECGRAKTTVAFLAESREIVAKRQSASWRPRTMTNQRACGRTGQMIATSMCRTCVRTVLLAE